MDSSTVRAGTSLGRRDRGHARAFPDDHRRVVWAGPQLAAATISCNSWFGRCSGWYRSRLHPRGHASDPHPHPLRRGVHDTRDCVAARLALGNPGRSAWSEQAKGRPPWQRNARSHVPGRSAVSGGCSFGRRGTGPAALGPDETLSRHHMGALAIAAMVSRFSNGTQEGSYGFTSMWGCIICAMTGALWRSAGWLTAPMPSPHDAVYDWLFQGPGPHGTGVLTCFPAGSGWNPAVDRDSSPCAVGWPFRCFTVSRR